RHDPLRYGDGQRDILHHPAPSPCEHSQGGSSRMKPRILFVDDEGNVLDGLRRVLRKLARDWHMTFVTTAQEALECLAQTGADVVVTDVTMPEMSGFDLLESMRQSQQTRDIPVVILTGMRDRSLKRRALDLGAGHFLTKPVDVEDLIACLRSMLRLKSYQDEIKAHNATLLKTVEDRTRELAASRIEIIWRLAKLGEIRDADTGN